MSLYRGLVTDNADPEGIMRVRAKVPQVFGQSETDWMWPSIPLALGVQVPAVGDPVWVMFEADDKSRPVWVGVWRTTKQGGLDPDFSFGGVVGETTYGLTPSNGSAATVSRSDHTHGSPIDSVPAHLLDANPHPQYATDADLAGYTTTGDLAAHVGDPDPHPDYATDSDVAAIQAIIDSLDLTGVAALQDVVEQIQALYWTS